jgi:hypothetical protein
LILLSRPTAVSRLKSLRAVLPPARFRTTKTRSRHWARWLIGRFQVIR